MSNLELNCKWHFAIQLGGREDGPNDPMQDNFKKTPLCVVNPRIHTKFA